MQPNTVKSTVCLEMIEAFVAFEILKRVGCRLDLADSGATCIEKVKVAHDKQTPYDLILMDIQMPDLDGVATTKLLRELGIPLPPIIAMTAHAMTGDREQCLDAGMNAYMAKPLSASALTAALETHASRQQ